MPSILVLTPDPKEAAGLLQGFARRSVAYEPVRLGALEGVALPSLDMLVAVGGNGKAQYGIQAQYLIDRCSGLEVLACVGAAGCLAGDIHIGDLVLGTSTIEHDYRERFHPGPLPRHDASPRILGDLTQLAKTAAFPFQVHVGVIASGDEDIIDAIRAAELREATDALCVAWEGSGGARAARLNGLEFIEIRAITDAADPGAAQSFQANVGNVMFNVVELMLAWSISRRSMT